jgi:hypothetical protein
VIEHRLPRSDRPYKEAFVDLIKSRPWDWFITIPIGECPVDELLLKRLRRIENELCRKFLVNRRHKLPDHLRFTMAVGFEGERECGTRHAHILAYVPAPTKIRISREMLVNVFPAEFRFRWERLKLESKRGEDVQGGPPWFGKLQFGRVNIARSIYAAKDVRQRDVPWSRFELVTMPKHLKFMNRNLSVIQNKNRQRRTYLKRMGDPLVTGHVV